MAMEKISEKRNIGYQSNEASDLLSSEVDKQINDEEKQI